MGVWPSSSLAPHFPFPSLSFPICELRVETPTDTLKWKAGGNAGSDLHSHRRPVSQGDANRSYSDEDQSSSNMEEFDKFQEGLDSSGGKRASTRHLGARSLHWRPRWAQAQHLLPLDPVSEVADSPCLFCVFLTERKANPPKEDRDIHGPLGSQPQG